jgi:hypothetical protein
MQGPLYRMYISERPTGVLEMQKIERNTGQVHNRDDRREMTSICLASPDGSWPFNIHRPGRSIFDCAVAMLSIAEIEVTRNTRLEKGEVRVTATVFSLPAELGLGARSYCLSGTRLLGFPGLRQACAILSLESLSLRASSCRPRNTLQDWMTHLCETAGSQRQI